MPGKLGGWEREKDFEGEHSLLGMMDEWWSKNSLNLEVFRKIFRETDFLNFK